MDICHEALCGYDCAHKTCKTISQPNSQHGCGKGIRSPTPSEMLLAIDGCCGRKSQSSSGTRAPRGYPCLTDGPTLTCTCGQHWVFSVSFERKITWSWEGTWWRWIGEDGWGREWGAELIKTHYMNVWSSQTIKSQVLFHDCKTWLSFVVPAGIHGQNYSSYSYINPIPTSILIQWTLAACRTECYTNSWQTRPWEISQTSALL